MPTADFLSPTIPRYGFGGWSAPFHEDSPLSPSPFYSVKQLKEMEAQAKKREMWQQANPSGVQSVKPPVDPYSVRTKVKYPALEAMSKQLLANVDLSALNFPTLKSATAGMQDAYGRYRGALDTTGYAGAQRGLDTQLGTLTAGAAGTARGIADEYGNLVSRYEKDQLAAYEAQLAEAARYRSEDIPAAINQALGQAARRQSYWKMGQPGLGLGSRDISYASRAATEASMPYVLNAADRYQAALGLKPGVLSNVAGAQTNYLAGFRYPMEQTIYGQGANVLAQQRQTEDKIKQLEISTAGMTWQAAIENLKLQGLPESVIEQVQMARLQRQRQQAGLLADIGNLAPLYQYQALEGPPLAGATQNYGGGRYSAPTTGTLSNDVIPMSAYANERYGNQTTTGGGGGGYNAQDPGAWVANYRRSMGQPTLDQQTGRYVYPPGAALPPRYYTEPMDVAGRRA